MKEIRKDGKEVDDMEEAARKSIEYGYGIITEGLANERKKGNHSLVKWTGNKYELEGRNKLKGLIEPLRTFENKGESIVHFSKYVAYSLPRSNMVHTRDTILKILNELGEHVENPEERWKIIHLMVGYMNWTVDSILSLATDYHNDKPSFKEHLEIMVKDDGVENIEEVVRKIYQWRSGWYE